MCTLTFFPLKEQQFVLTSSRDEQKTRQNSLPPSSTFINDIQIIRPIDGDAGGSWIGINNLGSVLCLLNGAFELHERQPPYRKSRGIILMDALSMKDEKSFLTYDLKNIEPFTLIWITSKSVLQLNEYRWDGKKLHHHSLDTNRAKIWSSATLYSKKIAQKRETWFREWIDNDELIDSEKAKVLDSLWKFHLEGGQKQKASTREQVLMRHSKGGTVSLTQAYPQENTLFMQHHNLNTDHLSKNSIKVR